MQNLMFFTILLSHFILNYVSKGWFKSNRVSIVILIQYIVLPLVHHSFICFISSVHAYTRSLILTYLLTAYQVPITMPGTGHPIVKKRMHLSCMELIACLDARLNNE